MLLWLKKKGKKTWAGMEPEPVNMDRVTELSVLKMIHISYREREYQGKQTKVCKSLPLSVAAAAAGA